MLANFVDWPIDSDGIFKVHTVREGHDTRVPIQTVQCDDLDKDL